MRITRQIFVIPAKIPSSAGKYVKTNCLFPAACSIIYMPRLNPHTQNKRRISGIAPARQGFRRLYFSRRLHSPVLMRIRAAGRGADGKARRRGTQSLQAQDAKVPRRDFSSPPSTFSRVTRLKDGFYERSETPLATKTTAGTLGRSLSLVRRRDARRICSTRPALPCGCAVRRLS